MRKGIAVLVAVTLFLTSLVTAFLVYYSPKSSNGAEKPFYFGVSFCGETVEEAKLLIDRVKNFTNLFVVDSTGITFDINNLNEVCDYVYDSGLYFLVFFISLHEEGACIPPEGDEPELVLRYNYYPHIWIARAKEKYGNSFTYTLLEESDFQRRIK